MTKPTLTVERLVAGTFREVGCWELNAARSLSHALDLPRQAGVYAFAIDEVVHYVGLASKSLRERLNFYRKPGASQRTNVRLNEIIRTALAEGTTVRIFVAHPTDHEWNGFKISGAEGLEAGLIATFDLPWNLRGAQPARPATPALRKNGSVERGLVADRIIGLVTRRPGMTELEIAKALYGAGAVQPQVNQHCRALVRRNLVERRGDGGLRDPFSYYPLGVAPI